MEWGEVTPPEHWDQLVAVRGTLCDLRHNLRTLYSYLDYAEKLATVAAEISYLSGNNAASDAICERIEQALRSCNIQKQLNQGLQEESLELQQKAIISSPQLEDKLVNDATDKKQQTTDDAIDKVKLTIDDALDKVKLATDNAIDEEKVTTDNTKDNNSDIKS
ncbi:PREDICTED: uncharacterized protein LOC106104087 isoform X2 [Papilio polytes]|nr:PREDICTED: uncharacterized protein LOC106104087 isoform X2 [Papilio polytes]